MGVDRTDYIILGYTFKPEQLKKHNINLDDHKFIPHLEQHRDLDILVYDVMNDKYLVFGKLINKAHDHEGTNFTIIQFADFFDDKENKRLKDKFIELFGRNIYNELDQDEPQVFVFSHYT